EQGEGVPVVRGFLLEPAQRRQRLLVLALVELQLRLGEQHGARGGGYAFVRLLEPAVAALVGALQVGRPCRLQVVEQRRLAARGTARQEALAAREIALGDFDDALRQARARAPAAEPRGGLPEAPRGAQQLDREPGRRAGQKHEAG